MRSTITFALMLLVLLGTACKETEKKTTQQELSIPVKTMALSQDVLTTQFSVSGQFTTDDETILSFKTGGVIQKIFVREGERVQKGQLLATLNLTEINAMTAQAKLALQKAERDFERAQNLYRDSVATLEQMQNARTALDLAKQQTTGAGFNQQSSEIRATSSGVVLQKFANDGQVTGPGVPVLMINGASSAKWLLKVAVSDKQWAAIQPGDKAEVVSDVLPDTKMDAVVLKKAEGIDPQSGTFQVWLQLTNPDRSTLAAGLFGKAILYPKQSQQAWAIPYDAILDGDAREAFVFITNDGKTAEKVKIKISRIDKNKVWVSAGLENARNLIISGSAYLNDGASISVVEP